MPVLPELTGLSGPINGLHRRGRPQTAVATAIVRAGAGC